MKFNAGYIQVPTSELRIVIIKTEQIFRFKTNGLDMCAHSLSPADVEPLVEYI